MTASATTVTPKFTRRDYERLPEGFPCQLVEGELVKEPSPIYRHQRVISRLFEALLVAVGAERVVTSPIDLFVDDYNVLQPDVAVFATPLSRTIRHIPVPAVVIEVLSPSTASRDRDQKTRIYLGAGVAEVWLIDPVTGAIDVHTPAGVASTSPDDRAMSTALPAIALCGAELIA